MIQSLTRLSCPIAMCLFLGTAAAAQVREVPYPSLASSISEDEEYGWEDPELWGSQSVEAIPGDARLLVDYQMTAGELRQRLTLYDEGFARVEWVHGTSTIDRALLLAEDAARNWRDIVGGFRLPSSSYRASERLSHASNAVTITLHRGEKPERYQFSTAAALPSELGTLRALLDALAQSMVEDRQVANPVSTYAPVVGDVLLDPEGNRYRIMRVVDSPRVVELRRADPPMTTWVPQRDLYTMFTAISPGGTSPK